MSYQVLSALIAGLFAHNAIFIHGEWHMHIPHIIVGHFLPWLLVLYCLFQIDETVSFGEALQSAAAIGASYLTALFTSMTIYRIFFHNLTKFPGPRLAAVSKLWHVFQIRDSTNYLFLRKLHEMYGTFIRTGPNEITLVHPAAFHLLDGWGTGTTKDIWYDILQPQTSAVFTRDEREHKEGRKVWAHSLSTKAMMSFHPRIAQVARSLSGYIKAHSAQPVDVNEVMSWFSFDVMGDVVFGQDFNLLGSGAWIPAIHHRDGALSLVGPIGDAIWIGRMAFDLIPFYGRVKDWFHMVSFCEDRIQERLNRGTVGDKLDMAKFFIDEYEMNSDVKTLKARNLWLAGTAVTAVVAGSDTTRAALIATCWFLSKYPEHANKILAELQDVDINDINVLTTLPHLEGFMHETLRLVPPAMTGNSRITGPNGLQVDNVLIPPFTKVTAPKYVIMRMESAFVYPDEFIPERWYSRPELIRDARAFAPFSVGGRQCVGKALAYAELRLVTAILLQHYHIQFAPGYDPETMWRDMKDQVTAQPGQVMCIFKPRS